MRVLVTGASGFLGANIGSTWTGDELVGACLTGAAAGYADCLKVDITDRAATDQMADCRPDLVIHAAALASLPSCEMDPHLAYITNVGGTLAAATAARTSGARFVYISSDAVFGGARGNYAETCSPAPGTVYGKTKWLGERTALRVHPDALVLRVNFFGWSPTGTRSILEFFVNALSHGRQVNGYTDYWVTSGYVGNLVESMQRLVDVGATGVYHLTAADAMSKYEFGCAVAEEFGLDADLIVPTSAPRRANLSLNCDKAAEVIGPLATQRDGIRRAHG